MKPRTAIALCLLVGLFAGFCREADGAQQPGGDAVELIRRDVDGDGQDELVLENRYLRVVLTTGIPPAADAGVSFFDALFGDEKPPSKYSDRFAWGGWIYNMTFKPTGQRWFLNNSETGWHGIPEEFEQPIKMKQTGPAAYDVLKIGVGRCRGERLANSPNLSLVKPVPWTHRVEDTPSGGKRVVFEQNATTPYGYAYAYRKEMILEPDAAVLQVRRRLRNTGTKSIATTWYTHGFWSPVASGQGHDTDSWVTVPLQLGTAPSGASVVESEPCIVPTLDPYPLIGELDGSLLAGNWYACGNRRTRDVFVTVLDTKPAYMRTWVDPRTFAYEPFLTLDLEPGEAREWSVRRFAGNGLGNVRDAGAGGVVGWTRPSAEKPDAISISFLPEQTLENLTLTVRAESLREGGEQSRTRRTVEIARSAPDAPFVKTFAGLVKYGMLYRIRITVTGNGRTVAAADRVLDARPDAATPRPAADAGGARALVLSQTECDPKSGKKRQTVSAAFLRDYLEHAGFDVTVADPAMYDGQPEEWSEYPVCLLADLDRIGGSLAGWLEQYVAAGNGLVLCGVSNLSDFEFYDLLPVERVRSSVSIESWKPRQATRRALKLPTHRYNFERAARHPALNGIPFHPKSYQKIGRILLVDPAPESRVLLRYAASREAPIPAASTSPALLISRYRKGRVAFLASPLDWGTPRISVPFCRVGEYHRKLFCNLTLWAADLLPSSRLTP